MLALLFGGQQRVVIDRVVAVVNGQVITLSELEFEARVALIQAGGLAAATAPLDDDALRNALDLSIAQRLELAEADRLEAFPLDEKEVDAALAAFRDRFPNPVAFEDFLARHEADLTRLAQLIVRGLRAAQFLESKVKLKAQIGEAELKRYYEENKAELGGSYAEVRSVIQHKLSQDRLKALMRSEIEQIRREADIRLIAPFARPAGERP